MYPNPLVTGSPISGVESVGVVAVQVENTVTSLPKSKGLSYLGLPRLWPNFRSDVSRTLKVE